MRLTKWTTDTTNVKRQYRYDFNGAVAAIVTSCGAEGKPHWSTYDPAGNESGVVSSVKKGLKMADDSLLNLGYELTSLALF